MKTADVRASFLKFFGDRGHSVVGSDSLIPSTDPTLLFTSAGMVQFKPNFQIPESSPYPRAASCQKCLRTSDIERVGTTLRHLTFFEMLGNFSFGDYFKQESIAWGWEFITKTMGLPGDRFVVSVYKDDDEAFGLWEKLVPKDRIYRLNEDTNFWTMGPTGPCGPCSEILWDRGPSWSCGKPTCSPACDCDRYLEIWNHVFTQFDRSADGTLTPLPRKNIDTGMGLERLTLLMQGKNSPFETDAFQTVMKDLAGIADQPLPTQPTDGRAPTREQASYRRIADHSRAVTFMICDGILPSNEGRGYVLRRLLRQAVRAGKTLGIKDPFLYRLTGTVIDLMKGAYPETLQRRETIASVVKVEEEKFLETLDTGTRLLEDMVKSTKAKSMTTLPGKEIFQLYETFGFPFELTKEMAEGFGLSVDTEGYERAQQQAVEIARQAWKGSGAQDVDRYRQWKSKIGQNTPFLGYDRMTVDAKILAPMYRKTGDTWAETQELKAGDEGEIVLEETSFYAEGGGQVGDEGTISVGDAKAQVIDTQAPVEGMAVHRVKVLKGVLKTGQLATAQVDPDKREGTMRHHTATHLLHRALREVLGPHVTQAGSLVAPGRLRFDFNHNAPLTLEERQRAEDLVNERILKDLHVRACSMTKNQAHDIGAMMLFGEKYGDKVRAVAVSEYDDCEHPKQAWSLELCGGTHVHKTGQVGMFKILSQASVSAGVRRIEAVAGVAAIQAVRKMEHQLATVAEALKANPDELAQRVERLLQEKKALERALQAVKSSAMNSKFEDLGSRAKSVQGVSIVAEQLEGLEDQQLREASDRLRDTGKLGVILLATAQEGKVAFVVSVQKDAAAKGLHAGKIAKEFAALIQGSGGGRPDFAQGGGKNPDALPGALAQAENLVKKLLTP
jgi:alanyl-tRNA synthetase